MSGAELLDRVEATHRKYVAHPSEHAAVAVTLWTVHAHVVTASDSSPRLALLSPEKQSGKTRQLEVLDKLVPNPMHTGNVTPAVLFRSIGSDTPPTVLFDEIDTVFHPLNPNEELRGLINMGHRQGAGVPRCEGPTHSVRAWPAYSAVALAGIGNLPDTIQDRCIVIRMRRRGPGETVTPFQIRKANEELEPLREELAAWGDDHFDQLEGYEPIFPAGMVDRPADVWEPLLAIAEVAAGEWPARARAAAVALTAEAATDEQSDGVRLLEDIREVFGDDRRLTTDLLLFGLNAMDESPWGEWKGSELSSRGLSALLKPFKIRPRKWRDGEQTRRGYLRGDFEDAWARYTPSLSEPHYPPHPPHVADNPPHATDPPQRDACHTSDVSDVADDRAPEGKGTEAVAGRESVADDPPRDPPRQPPALAAITSASVDKAHATTTAATVTP